MRRVLAGVGVLVLVAATTVSGWLAVTAHRDVADLRAELTKVHADAEDRDEAVVVAVAELFKRTNATAVALDRRVDDLETPDLLVPAWRRTQSDEDVSALRGQVQSLELRLSSLCWDLKFDSVVLHC